MKKYLFLLSLLGVLSLAPSTALAQNSTSGDISGSVTDPTGAAVPGASVTIVNVATGIEQKATSNSGGTYHASLLKPGIYKITITAPNFSTTAETVTVSQGVTTNGDIKLSVGKQSTVVEVASDAIPLLQTEDAQISTTFNLEQVQSLPNPGGDITYYAQTTPGVVMNTGGGYGNFSFAGLPGTSNNFTVNGFQENDPFLNLNNSGPTNLLLGQNDIGSVTILSTAYGAEFGSFGGVQVNEISRSGTNKFHGNASYWWNGSSINANDYFNKQSGGTRPFDNDNQWAASIGGPIVKDKTFFFVDWEGLRFITAPVDLNYVPSALYQSTILGADAGCDNATSSLFVAGNGGECAFYKNIFNLYNGAPGISKAIAIPGDPYAVQFRSTPKIFGKEALVTARIDQHFTDKDQAFIHFKYDNGTQPTYVDPINSTFNSVSYQPSYEGQIVENHVFTPNLVNQFNGGVAHYSAYFQSTNQNAANALYPGTLIVVDPVGDQLAYLGGIAYDFPQGRNATQYSLQDDLSWQKGNHAFKFGYAFKKDDITNLDLGVYTNPLSESLDYVSAYGFSQGYNYLYRQTYPNYLSAPTGLYSEGFYAQDTWKLTPSFMLTAGLRIEHNSNPVCPHNCFSRFNQSAGALQANTTLNTSAASYQSQIAYNQHTAFAAMQAASYEPRLEMVWSPFGADTGTVVRGGFGMFSDVFPGQVADEALRNAPQDTRFQYASTGSTASALNPSAVAGTGIKNNGGRTFTNAAQAAFQSGVSNFYNGGSYASISAEAPAFVRPNFSTSAPKIQYPTYEEYSLQVQQAVGRNTTIQVGYLGNHGYHEPVVAGNANEYFAGGFGGIPTARPFASFGTVTNVTSNASSNYNGVMTSVIHRSKYVDAQLNYTYSHALDQISNGGFLGFTSTSITAPLSPTTLAYNYGNADYDVRNSLNGNYLIHIPSYGQGVVKEITGNWTVAGTFFYRAGFPFTVVDSNIYYEMSNPSGNFPAQIVNKNVKRHCDSKQYTNGVTQCLADTDFTDPSALIPGQRNQFYGPHYFSTDMTLNKGFDLGFEGMKVILGAVAYNLFNHANFAAPNNDYYNAGGYGFGQIQSTVSVPTSIYGSGLGGNASPRILQLSAKISF